jgi:hypothetical protein
VEEVRRCCILSSSGSPQGPPSVSQKWHHQRLDNGIERKTNYCCLA